jgi:hypothetical protein
MYQRELYYTDHRELYYTDQREMYYTKANNDINTDQSDGFVCSLLNAFRPSCCSLQCIIPFKQGKELFS